MRPLNLRVILLLGGILLITLAFQVFQRYTVENFADADPAMAAEAAKVAEAAKAAEAAKVAETAKATDAAKAAETAKIAVESTNQLDAANKLTPVPVTSGSGVTYYDIPMGNNQILKLTMPAQPPMKVTVPEGPLPSTLPPIK